MLFGREWIRGRGVLDGHTVGRLTIVNIDVGDLGEIKGLAGIRRIDLTRFVEECDFECEVGEGNTEWLLEITPINPFQNPLPYNILNLSRSSTRIIQKQFLINRIRNLHNSLKFSISGFSKSTCNRTKQRFRDSSQLDKGGEREVHGSYLGGNFHGRGVLP